MSVAEKDAVDYTGITDALQGALKRVYTAQRTMLETRADAKATVTAAEEEYETARQALEKVLTEKRRTAQTAVTTAEQEFAAAQEALQMVYRELDGHVKELIPPANTPHRR